MTQQPLRCGYGYDIHRLAPDRALVLGGVVIPYHLGLAGHSDADVLLHAVMDGLLGAAALGDIGQHFPPSDDRWRGESSLELLGRVVRLLDERGYDIVNVDGTVVAEAPRMGPHVAEMRRRMAERMLVDIEQVSVKATTNEGLGPEGRGEGISAHAVALIALRSGA
jgi:2-C-methyl-D-erythritol 2,4-cyclodiphosphate synthase